MRLLLEKKVEDYIKAQEEEAYELLKTLAKIPAPSGQEEKRAEFCKAFLEDCGAEGVYIDKALNVVYPVGVTEENPLVVVMAHMDVVFPDTTELPLEEKDGKLCCPGVGDDTANLVALLLCAKYIAEQHIVPKDRGLLLVCNSCEEGLGNLRGSREICENYGKRIQEFISLDGDMAGIVNKAVGSRRFEVTMKAQGGHSYGCFGHTNAIALLSQLVTEMYQIQVPPYGKTTYNVGTISGGTSVNTIAQEAHMLCEYRSDDSRGLTFMEEQFDAIFRAHQEKGEELTVKVVGERPCGCGVDEESLAHLTKEIEELLYSVTRKEAVTESGSTDCNIPLSIGIPSVCYGCYYGKGAHTREEYVWKDSLSMGYRVAFLTVLRYFE